MYNCMYVFVSVLCVFLCVSVSVRMSVSVFVYLSIYVCSKIFVIIISDCSELILSNAIPFQSLSVGNQKITRTVK